MNNFIYIETYGCSANKNNSEILAGLLRQSGYQLTNNEKIADTLIINTCIVKGKTETKIKRRIQDMSGEFPNKLIIIAGCMPETDFNSLKKLNPKLLFLGTHHVKDISRLISDYKNNNINNKDKQKFYLSKQQEEKLLTPKIPINKLISITQISEGCLGNCSYCKTKLAKGTLHSYDEEKILKSIESDLESGAKEVWLTSQDCASYNLDKNKQNLPELLKKILSLKHNFKLRLGMMNPNNVYPVLDELIEVYKNPKIYKFIHIPIQSASDSVLKDMNRFYKIKIVEEIITKLKKEVPDMVIATDIIVGYPTEKQSDHKKNLEFIKKYKPDVLNLSKFSSHKQTPASKLKTLPLEIINKRTSEIMQEHRIAAMENKQKFQDKIIKVTVNNKTKMQDVYEARDENYNIILINSKENIIGKNIKVKIKTIGVHHMIAEIIDN